LKVLTALVFAIPVLSGCANQGSTSTSPIETAKASPTQTVETLASKWEANSVSEASLMAYDLAGIGLCDSKNETVDELMAETDDWAADTLRACYNFADFDSSLATAKCPLTYTVMTQVEQQPTSNELNYDGGYSLARMTGDGWSIYISPEGSIKDKGPKAAMAACKDLVDEAVLKIGGNGTLNGSSK
ncbi:MAG: hypothetical protein KGL77_03630, partial [Actinomycetales bacterium]|nr:hypothetical protein [Actinomycetales bacterium]